MSAAASFMQGILYSFASFTHSSTLICPAPLAKLVKCIMAVRGLTAWRNSSRVSISISLMPVVRSWWSNGLRCDFWMMTSDFIPVRSGNLLDECFVVAGKDSGQSGLDRRRRAGRDQRGVSIGQFEHFARSDFPPRLPDQECCTKWRPAWAITASSSGRRMEPPSMVIVPSQLMTVVTPSSS